MRNCTKRLKIIHCWSCDCQWMSLSNYSTRISFAKILKSSRRKKTFETFNSLNKFWFIIDAKSCEKLQTLNAANWFANVALRNSTCSVQHNWTIPKLLALCNCLIPKSTNPDLPRTRAINSLNNSVFSCRIHVETERGKVCRAFRRVRRFLPRPIGSGVQRSETFTSFHFPFAGPRN